MPQPPAQFLRNMPKITPGWLLGFMAVALLAALYVGQYAERSRPVAPQTKVQHAIQALQSGYDQNALAILKPLAGAGNPKAQYWLADIYENGLGVTRDMTTAVALLEKSASQGFLPAERRLGALYLRGNETLQNFGKAQTWLHKAALAGSGEAQRELGHIYALGLGVAADRPKGVRLVRDRRAQRRWRRQIHARRHTHTHDPDGNRQGRTRRQGHRRGDQAR